MSNAAVVVSYNRRELLEKCISALTQQTRPLDEIIVVDNGSTDGGPDMVRKLYPGVFLFETGANLGGAGGFAWGVELAAERGHDYVWLMDDDGEPDLNSFEELMAAVETSDDTLSFAASMVTTHDTGTPNVGNLPVLSTDMQHQLKAQRNGTIAVRAATFVGVLVNVAVARTTHLPQRDYFIWIDDMEYTLRLSRLAPAVMVSKSTIKHPMNAGGSKDMKGRLFYHLRNQIWVIKSNPELSLPRKIFDSTFYVVHALGQGPHAADKGLWARSIAKGIFEALFRKPREEPVGSLVRSLPAHRRSEILP
ncbi:glycosyltransferase [Arthrobacter sp. NamB2]|uniref:glycosyltransferase family 2 protein n=1 Tax=Arthrobacter sp. NamB2 TaxID=2576035 RepID=UPI0010C94941|nr:glycosyltransferase family 2 protein [Arthrobacter sp. NamB2]TKV29713.1 glycosyltransferase [Arthrobacter sp. NamB2]